MKILFINTLYYPNRVGGAERSVQLLAECLAENGHDITVLSIASQKGIDIQTINGIKSYYVGLKNIYFPFQESKNELLRLCWHVIDIYNPFMARLVSKIIHLERPDVIHTNNLSGFSVSVWSVAKKYRIPLIHTVRDYYLPCYFSTMYKKGRNCDNQCIPCYIFSRVKKWKSNLPDSVVGISNYILHRHLKLGFFSNVKHKTVIFNSCFETNLNTFEKPSANTLRIGFLGKVGQAKGIELLLDAFSKLKCSNAELFVGGDCDHNYMAYLRNKYILAKNTHYLDFVDPEDFFKTVDILVVPSVWNEPFGRIIIEAYQHGVPVIGSTRGGIPEIIEPEITGFLFDPDSPEALSAILERICEKPFIVSKMKEQCFNKSIRFSRDAISASYIDEYRKII